MSDAPMGRRERNKAAKLERIVAAAGELFAERGVDDVTTQQIADRADIGTGTLFLYAKTKGELLLMVQNAHYAQALQRGRRDAEAIGNPLDAVMAILVPIVECNRAQVENGRTYLREMVFGDPEEPHHGAALAIVGETEAAVSAVLHRSTNVDAGVADALAHVVSAVMFMALATSAGADRSTGEVVDHVRAQIALVLPRRGRVSR